MAHITSGREYGFFLDVNADYARPWRAGRTCGRSLAEKLDQEHFTSLGDECYRKIFLYPAAKFRSAPCILEEDKSTMVKKAGVYIYGQMRARGTHGGGTRERAVYEAIGPDARELYIEQSRAILRVKELPSFQHERRVFNGVFNGRHVQVECHALSHCPQAMAGAYATIELYGDSREHNAWMQTNLVDLLGRQSLRRDDRGFQEILMGLNPTFPWFWQKLGN